MCSICMKFRERVGTRWNPRTFGSDSLIVTRKLIIGINDLETAYPHIAREWDFSRNEGTPRDYTYKSMYKAHWKCSTCEKEWQAQIRDRVKSKYQLCPDCTAKKRGETRHKQALERQGGIIDPLLLKEWDYEANELPPSEYTSGSNLSVNWICSKCGYHFKAKIGNRTILERGCPCCANKVVVPGINDLATTHPALAAEWHPTKNGEITPEKVTYGTGKKVWWLCPEGHEYQATVLHRTSGTNCPICNSGRQTSFAEQAVFFYVKKIYPDAISRYTATFLGKMELDIFIPSKKLAIEYDGEAWHKNDKRDREERKYAICQENGIRLLRLMETPPEGILTTADDALSISDGPMYEMEHLQKVIRVLIDSLDPESNFWTRKKPIFHSSMDINLKRDELEIRKYMTALKSDSLEDLYPNLAEEWHPTKNGTLTPSKVKRGSDIKIWWICPDCGNEYQASPAHRTTGTGCPQCGKKKSNAKRSKAVQMIDMDTNEVIRTFPSISEASRQMSISSGNIAAVCKGTGRKHAGGYFWNYLPSEDA